MSVMSPSVVHPHPSSSSSSSSSFRPTLLSDYFFDDTEPEYDPDMDTSMNDSDDTSPTSRIEIYSGNESMRTTPMISPMMSPQMKMMNGIQQQPYASPVNISDGRIDETREENER